MKTINVRVIPNAKINKVTEENKNLRVHINAPAHDGMANKAVIKILADYYNVKKNQIQIVKGEKSRDKVIVVN